MTDEELVTALAEVLSPIAGTNAGTVAGQLLPVVHSYAGTRVAEELAATAISLMHRASAADPS